MGVCAARVAGDRTLGGSDNTDTPKHEKARSGGGARIHEISGREHAAGVPKLQQRVRDGRKDRWDDEAVCDYGMWPRHLPGLCRATVSEEDGDQAAQGTQGAFEQQDGEDSVEQEIQGQGTGDCCCHSRVWRRRNGGA